MHTLGDGRKVLGRVWVLAAVMATLALAATQGCSDGGSAIDPADGSTDAAPDMPALATDVPLAADDASASDTSAGDAAPGPASAAPTGPAASLTLDTPTPMTWGSHCGRTVLYFDAGHTSSYGLDIGSGGAVHATSSALNMINASVYCTFTLPAETKSLVFHHGAVNIKIDPTSTYPGASGGGLGFMIYLGAATPAGGTSWGDYGKPALARWKEKRPDWNNSLPAEDDALTLSAAATTATFAVYLVDAWGNIPVDGDVVSTAVEARSTP